MNMLNPDTYLKIIRKYIRSEKISIIDEAVYYFFLDKAANTIVDYFVTEMSKDEYLDVDGYNDHKLMTQEENFILNSSNIDGIVTGSAKPQSKYILIPYAVDICLTPPVIFDECLSLKEIKISGTL